MKFVFLTNRLSWPNLSLRHPAAMLPGNWPALAVGLAALSALLIPANLLASQPFHHDEALYATWALEIASGTDPLLAHTPVDKPPLFLYLLAGVLKLFDVTETAARLPSLAATTLSVILTFWLGRKLYGDGAGVLAACLVTLSPFTILFAPTAFTDPLLVTFILVACLAAAHGRAGWAGVALGLAIATKQQGIFFMPLVLGFLVSSIKCQVSSVKCQVSGVRCQVSSVKYQVSGKRGEGSWRSNVSHILEPKTTSGRFTFHVSRFTFHVSRFTFHVSRFLLAAALTLLPVLIWNLSRSQTTGFLVQSLVNYGGLSSDLASFSERWTGFIELLHYGTASPLLNLIFIVGLPLRLLYGLWLSRRRLPTGNQPVTPPPLPSSPPPVSHSPNLPLSQPPPSHSPNLPLSQPPTLPDWILTLFILVFLLGHAFLSFQVWDRYLLGLIPLLALLMARVLLLPWTILKQHWPGSQMGWLPVVGLVNGLLLVFLLARTLAQPVQDAANARYPLGSNSNALRGIEQIVAYLQGHAGANHTLYHRWLGTHWRFYLWDYPYDLQYWSSPAELAAKARPGHLIAFPSWRSETEARLALAEAGLELRELTRAYNPAGYPSIILYQVDARQ